jgi:glutaminase
MLEDDINNIYKKLKKSHIGQNADYIPELKKVNPNLYAISIYTVDGQVYNIGDYETEFAIESCSKVFTLSLVLEKYGIPFMKKNIGEGKTLVKFNSINETLENKLHTINSFNNGGAMATTSLLYEKNVNKSIFEKKIIKNMSDFAGRKLHVDKKIYTSEINNAEHNLAIAYLLKSYDMFYGDVQESVDVYTRQCSVMLTSHDLAIMAATLANKGVNPKTKKKIVDSKYISYILTHMEENGLYEESDHWMSQIGFPAKSGVSGALMVVIPNVMGIGIYSPRLNKHGNSDKGIKTMKLLTPLLKKYRFI